MFNIGDRVRITATLSNYPEARIGMVGTVRVVRVVSYHDDVGVEWDSFNRGHNLGGRASGRSGYWVHVNQLRLDVPVRPGSVEEYIQRALS